MTTGEQQKEVEGIATPLIYGPNGQALSSRSGYGDAGASYKKRALKAFRAYSAGAEMDIDAHNATLRQRARMLDMAAPMAASAVRTNRTNVVGCGLKLKARVNREILRLDTETANQIEKRIEAEFALWAENKKHCDATGVNDFYAMQQLALMAWLMSGDVLPLIKHVGRSRMYPYSLRLHIIEADRVCTPQSGTMPMGGMALVDGRPLNAYQPTTEGTWSNGNKIHDGVEVDKNGAIVAYHICSAYPQAWGIGSEKPTWTRVEAYGSETGLPNILHVMDAERPEQYRGVPYLAHVIEPILQTRRYTEAELMAALVQSFFTAFIKTEAPDGAMPYNETGEGITRDPNSYEMGPGTVNVMGPGEDVTFGNPNRPSSGFGGFVNAMAEQVGAALEIPRDLLMKSFNASYSASRAALLEAWKAFRMRREWFVSDFCRPAYAVWMSEAVALGRIDAPGFFDDPLVQAAWLGSEWIGPSQGQLDPVKEVTAEILACENGFSTHEQSTIRLNGGSFEANVDRLTRENAQLGEAKAPMDSAALEAALQMLAEEEKNDEDE